MRVYAIFLTHGKSCMSTSNNCTAVILGILCPTSITIELYYFFLYKALFINAYYLF